MTTKQGLQGLLQVALLILSACGGSSNHSRTVGGTASGVQGNGLVLQLNGGDEVGQDR